jgi:hypothetical protein
MPETRLQKKNVILGGAEYVTDMPIKKRGPGALPGSVYNPTGKNQFAGDRGKSISCRLPIELDEVFRDIMAAEGKTNTEAITEAITLWIAERQKNN